MIMTAQRKLKNENKLTEEEVEQQFESLRQSNYDDDSFSLDNLMTPIRTQKRQQNVDDELVI